jgi:tRNA A-37 threonylcarbamoyl transferase component Bud32
VSERDQLPTRFGPFVLLRLLGVGGMGSAYLARHADWKSGLVVKRMHRHFLEDETIFKRFVHEAEVATYVRHENVAPLVAMGTVGEEPFIATEFVFGIPVSTIVERVQSSKTTPVPYPVALRLAIGLCRGVEAIHEARDVETGEPLDLIHRDIGARNVLIGFDGRLRIIDLGLGKSILADWNTAADVFAGSPDYMPPEQAMGHRVDRRADVYSAAVTIWELFSGKKRIDQPTIAGRIAAALDAHAEQLRPHRPEASLAMEDALKRAMAREVGVRTPSIGLLREALELELQRVGPETRRADVIAWLDVACATLIAKQRRAIREAEAVAAELDLVPSAPEAGRTQYLAAQPIIFMPPMDEREISISERPPAEAASGAARAMDHTRSYGVRAVAGARVLGRSFALWIASLDPTSRIGLAVVPGLLAVLVLLVLVMPSRRDVPTAAPLSVGVPPPPHPVVSPPAPPAPPAAVVPPSPGLAEVDPEDEPPGEPEDPSAEPGERSDPSPRRSRLSGAQRERKNKLVVRLRRLRRKSFDVAWQRQVTELGKQLSRARTDSTLDRIDGQITRMEARFF